MLPYIRALLAIWVITSALLLGPGLGPLGEVPVGLALLLASLASTRFPALRWVGVAAGIWLVVGPLIRPGLPRALMVSDVTAGLFLIATSLVSERNRAARYVGDRGRDLAY